MALMISCDLINNDLIVKLYIFILYLNLCNIFRWDNFLYRKDFYIERIYYQFKLYIYCHVFVAFLRIYRRLCSAALVVNYLRLTKRHILSVSNSGKCVVARPLSCVQSLRGCLIAGQFLAGSCYGGASLAVKLKTVAGFCVLRISTTDGADYQLWCDQ